MIILPKTGHDVLHKSFPYVCELVPKFYEIFNKKSKLNLEHL